MTEQAEILNELRKEQDQLAKDVYAKYSQKDIVKVINKTVCHYFGVTYKLVISDIRTEPNVATARYCIFYLCNIYTCFSLRRIAREYKTSLASVRRGFERLYNLDYHSKRDIVLGAALNQFKKTIEESIKANMDFDINSVKTTTNNQQ